MTGFEKEILLKVKEVEMERQVDTKVKIIESLKKHFLSMLPGQVMGDGKVLSLEHSFNFDSDFIMDKLRFNFEDRVEFFSSVEEIKSLAEEIKKEFPSNNICYIIDDQYTDPRIKKAEKYVTVKFILNVEELKKEVEKINEIAKESH